MKKPSALIVLVLLLAPALVLAAQVQPPISKDKKEQPEPPKDAVARVAKDMQSAEERLKKTDTGDVTRKIQRDIIDGLDELIKQNSKSQNSQSTKTTKMQKSTPKQGAGDPSGAMKEKDNQLGQHDRPDENDHGRAKGGKEDGPQGKDKEKGKGEGDPSEKEATAKGGGKEDDKDKQKGLAKANENSNDGGQGIAKADKSASPKTDVASDLYRLDWGHLPLTRRLEMDAYSRERFMPRYDEALQQYYRSIAEQGQRKND